MRKLLLITLLFAGPSFGATCKISEYSDIISDAQGNTVSVANEPAITTQSVTYTTSSQSAALNSNTRFIRIVCDAKAHFVVGTDPSADGDDPYLTADVPEYFGVFPHEVYKIAFYDGSS